MEVFRQELNAFPLRALLDQAAEEIGEDGLERVLRKYGVGRRDISDSSVWVSVAFVDAVLRDISELLDDTAFLERASVRGLTPRYMGPLYPLMVGFGSPMFVYRQIPRGGARMDKLGTWRADDLKRGHVRMVWTPNPAADQRPFICRFRSLQLGYAPVLFSRPPAQVVHDQCIFHGAAECVFDVTWEEAPRRWQMTAGALLGLSLGATTGFVLGTPLLGTLGLACGLGLGGWALGKTWEQRQELQLRLKDIDEHNRALETVTKRNEQRYAELLEAKADVDLKVEQRTAELRLATQQLSETLSKVQELDRAKTTFFANVSHDLRTPLTLILGPLGEMVQGREPPGGTALSLDVMQRNALRLLELINQLLDLAKIDAGKMQVARIPTDLAELAKTVEGRFTGAAEQRKLTLAVKAVPLPALLIDPAWIETALTNLVGNAMRFARDKITLHVREEVGVVLLEVEDDGPGIDAASIGAVFERFAQGSDEQARKGGTGLGLAIVREAARLHGGDATVRSEPNVATVFTLTLPRQMSADAAGDSLRPPAPEAGSATNASITPQLAAASAQPNARPLDRAGPSPNAPLVVVIDDDDDLRAFTSDVLAAEYRVRGARNGEDGLRVVQECRPDAVVSDVVMPVMDGYQLCKRLRALDEARTLPVILLTARRDVGRVLEGFEAGADDYLTKPFQARELLARVSVHVRLRRIVSEMAHRERLASLGVLAASLAHQVRNPLNAILAGLPAVQRRLGAKLDGRDLEIFAAMLDSGERINTLIADLMDLSRVDQETVSRFRPTEGIQSCVRLLEARLGSGVTIDAELDSTIELEGKAGDMSHVFLNLIDNAVRAAEPEGRVHVSARRSGDTFVFEVADTGSGVAPDKVEAVFVPFFTTRQAGEGTGLGLAIARQVVIQHGGTITVGRSELGGALFTVTLPAPPLASLPPDPRRVALGRLH